MLSHENVIACVSSVCLQLGEHRPNRHDVMISFLPLAHMLEHCCQVLLYCLLISILSLKLSYLRICYLNSMYLKFQIAMYMVGASVGFYGGDIRQLIDDFKVLKPTVTPAVPRLLNRIHDKVGIFMVLVLSQNTE